MEFISGIDIKMDLRQYLKKNLTQILSIKVLNTCEFRKMDKNLKYRALLYIA